MTQPEKIYTRVVVSSLSGSTPLHEFISIIEDISKYTGDLGWKDLCIEADKYDGDVNITALRLETDYEHKKRIDLLEHFKQKQEKRDKEEYERLSKKYGKNCN